MAEYVDSHVELDCLPNLLAGSIDGKVNAEHYLH